MVAGGVEVTTADRLAAAAAAPAGDAETGGKLRLGSCCPPAGAAAPSASPVSRFGAGLRPAAPAAWIGLLEDDDESIESADEFPDDPESEPGPARCSWKCRDRESSIPASWASGAECSDEGVS